MARERELEVEDDAATVENAQKFSPLHGDLLEFMLSRLPLIDLVPAARVSTSWNGAVFSSLRNFNPPKPWLLVHTQAARSLHAATTHAYDPRSHVWMEIDHPPTKLAAAVCSSDSTLLYALSPSRFSFSFDPLNLTWHHASPPLVWRIDPIVALVGHHVVVAGGVCDFEDDPMAVESYDLRTRTWSTCESMPGTLKDSSALTWLSVAASGSRMYVTEKVSGLTYSYDPADKAWRGPYDLKFDQSMYFCVVAFSDGGLVLAGLIGAAENFKGLKIWRVDCESGLVREIAEMPAELRGELIDDDACVYSVAISASGNILYLHSPSAPERVVWCDLAAASGVPSASAWGSVRNAAVNDRSRMGRMVFTCADVSVAELQTAVELGKRRFRVMETPTRR